MRGTRHRSYAPKTTYLSDRGIRVLGEHALTLNPGDPVRETIRLLIDRWHNVGQQVTFIGVPDDDPFEGLTELIEEAA